MIAFAALASILSRTQFQLDREAALPQKLPAGIVQRPVFLNQAKMLDAFKAAKVKVIGKAISDGFVFTPRTPFSSMQLLMDCRWITCALQSQNQWGVGFDIMKSGPSTSPMLVTLSGHGMGVVKLELTTLVNGLQVAKTTWSQDCGATDQSFTVPVVVTSPGASTTITFWSPRGGSFFWCNGIEVRTLD